MALRFAQKWLLMRIDASANSRKQRKGRPDRSGRPLSANLPPADPVGSEAVVHVELDRRRRGFPAQHFGPLEFEVSFDLVLGEHAALE